MNIITYEFVLRLFVAAMLGGVIGLEREYRAKEAGFRTHFLVALGSCLLYTSPSPRDTERSRMPSSA